jgi:hypothetical protein
MDGHRRIEYEREVLQLYKPTQSHSSQASSAGTAGTPGCPELPRRRRQAPRRPAKTLLLSLLAGMAAFGESLELGPFDNPFALLGMRRTSIEAAMRMENKDYEKAYRMASKVIHPDKVKDQTDEKLKAIMSEQFRKATLAKEMLIVPDGDPALLERRHTYIRRFLWTEKELEYEGGCCANVEGSMIGEEATREHFQKNLTKKYDVQASSGAKIRVLPGVGRLQGHLLQAFSRRSFDKTKKSEHLAKNTGGFAQEKSLAVVQHGSLLMFRGRPFEVPHGCTTKEAKWQAKEELNEAVLELLVKVKHKRYLDQARKRRAECLAKDIKDDSYSNAQLKEASRNWRKAARHRLKIIKAEAQKRVLENKSCLLDAPTSRSLRNSQVKKMYQEFRNNLKALKMVKPAYKPKVKSKEAWRRQPEKKKGRPRKKRQRGQRSAAAGTPGGAASSSQGVPVPPWRQKTAKAAPKKKQMMLCLEDAVQKTFTVSPPGDEAHSGTPPESEEDASEPDAPVWQSKLCLRCAEKGRSVRGRPRSQLLAGGHLCDSCYAHACKLEGWTPEIAKDEAESEHEAAGTPGGSTVFGLTGEKASKLNSESETYPEGYLDDP